MSAVPLHPVAATPALPVWMAAQTAPPPLASRRHRRVVQAVDGVHLTVDGRRLLGFCSNDYLGLAGDPALSDAAIRGIGRWGVGAGASHLISGHTSAHQAVEDHAARWLGCERALLFSSGYLANLAVITALADRGTAIFADRLNHACLNDGARLSGARLKRYPHGDLLALRRLLEADASPKKWVLTDAVFSMDGDLAPLAELLSLCHEFDAMLLVDDAHGFGVLGDGRGSLAELGLVGAKGLDPRMVVMVTLGKAAGVAGALVCGAAPVIEALVQGARSYVYTTAAPPALAEAVLAALLRLADADCTMRRARVLAHARRLRSFAAGGLAIAPIVPILLGSDARAVSVAEALLARGLWVPAIRPPTVPAGTARLRVSLSAAHTTEQVDQLIDALKELQIDG